MGNTYAYEDMGSIPGTDWCIVAWGTTPNGSPLSLCVVPDLVSYSWLSWGFRGKEQIVGWGWEDIKEWEMKMHPGDPEYLIPAYLNCTGSSPKSQC